MQEVLSLNKANHLSNSSKSRTPSIRSFFIFKKRATVCMRLPLLCGIGEGGDWLGVHRLTLHGIRTYMCVIVCFSVVLV